jgi:hypothetical protein
MYTVTGQHNATKNAVALRVAVERTSTDDIGRRAVLQSGDKKFSVYFPAPNVWGN